ncbi:MAG TPA: electron transfer flavoprotein subunit beta/FixA family protein [Nocardioides sp.]|jgi:electron transfer flavoprotein beta subunit|nr:electron transfer flavoprotein subunit beta/FixA family protein [Nocardioides sp.]
MVNVLVCVKRVPDSSSQVVLTPDNQAVDGRMAGYTISPHEECAIELAVRIADATSGQATVLTLGPAEASEQLRTALALGCSAAVHIEADGVAFGPADVAREIAAVVRAHGDEGRGYDLVLIGNDASDTGDFQVGIRLAYALGLPVVNGVSTIEVADGVASAHVDGPEGPETYSVPTPMVATVLEGGVEPRYPTLKGRMAAKKIEIESRTPTTTPVGSGRVQLKLPPPSPSTVEILGEGPDAAPAVVDLFEKLGVR